MISRRWSIVCLVLGLFTASGIGLASDSDVPLATTHTDANLKWGPCPPLFPAGCEIAVLHGDPAKPNADVFLKVPARYAIPPHWHTSAERMVLVSGTLEVEYHGHEPRTLRVGTYAYGPARAVHEATCGDAGPCVLFIAFESPVDAQPPAASTE